MNNAKMWLVVKPTVGVPLFLSAVAIGSLAVHVGVISSGVGAWYGPILTGGETMEASAAVQTEQQVLPASVSGGDMIVTLPDGTMARLVLEPVTTLAAAD